MTLKERKIDSLRNRVIDRYQRAGKTVTPDMANSIWFSLMGVYEREGYNRAKLYAETAELI